MPQIAPDKSNYISVFLSNPDSILDSEIGKNYLQGTGVFGRNHVKEDQSGLLKAQRNFSFKNKFSTLLNEAQLEKDHGLQVVGQGHSEQWLIPAAFEEVDGLLGQNDAVWKCEFEDRLAALRESADEEDIAISEASIDFAREAIDSLRGSRRPSIFVVGCGNIRFVWHAPSGAQVGWQFLGSDRIQFVMLGGDEAPSDRFYGEGNLKSVLRQLRASGLARVTFG